MSQNQHAGRKRDFTVCPTRFHGLPLPAIPRPQPSPRNDWTKDAVAATLCRLHKRYEIMDSPRSKASHWIGDDARVELPSWSTLLHDELYGPEQQLKEGLTRRYSPAKPKIPLIQSTVAPDTGIDSSMSERLSQH